MLIEINRQDPNLPIPMPIKGEDGDTKSWLTYYFIGVDPKDALSPHVADVTDAAHIKRFLSLDGYDAYVGPDPVALVKPVPMLKAPKQNAAGKLGNHPAPTPYGKSPELVRTPVQIGDPPNVTTALGSAPVIDYRAASANGLRDIIASKPPVEDVRAALAAEKARTDAQPRKSWSEIAEQYVASKS